MPSTLYLKPFFISMDRLLMVCGALSLAAWAYLLFARGGFWRVPRMVKPVVSSGTLNKTVAVVVPARNEADVIAHAVTSLLNQQIHGRVHVFVVDDGSDDGTAEVARGTSVSFGAEERLTVIRGKLLPSGWSGKIWAQQQGKEQALQLNPDYLLLTDADIQHGPESLARLVSIAESQNLDLISQMVMLHCDSWFERWLIPAFVFFFFMLYPPSWISNRRKKVSGAAGGCMLIRPEALAKAGGFEAIRCEIIDDCALARAVKKSGGTVWLDANSEQRSIRPYRSVAEIGQMISRSAFNQLRHSSLLLAGTVLGLVIIYLLPVALLFSPSVITRALGIASCVAMLTAYLPMIRFYRLNPLWALSLPASALFYMGATVHSALQYWSGRGGKWKGRVQDQEKQ